MLNTLMDISEAETGTMRLERERLNLAAVVRDAVALYEDVAEEKGVSLRGDGARSDSCWSATAIACARRSPTSSTTRSSTPPPGGRVAIDVRADGGHAVIVVRDTGIGIAPDGPAAHLGAALPGRRQPIGARTGPRPEPGQGHRRGPRRRRSRVESTLGAGTRLHRAPAAAAGGTGQAAADRCSPLPMPPPPDRPPALPAAPPILSRL